MGRFLGLLLWFLGLLLWSLVLATVFCANFAFSAVDLSSSGSGGPSLVAQDHQQSAAVRRFERSLARVQPLLQRYGYGVAFVAVMVEGMGIPTFG